MEDIEVESRAYRAIGLIANPFGVVPDEESGDTFAVAVVLRSASLSYLGALDAALSSPDHRPVVIRKPKDIPVFFPVGALSQILRVLAKGEIVEDALAVYVPLDMMKMGRVRAVLSLMAEALANRAPHRTIGLWCARALRDPDTTLDEWSAVSELDVAALEAEASADPEAFAERVFGAPEPSREGAGDLEVLMKVASARRERLESDPDETVDTTVDEVAAADPLADAFVTPLGEVSDEALTEGEPDEEVSAIRDYVAAYVGAHLSPVIARGIVAYSAQGMNSMAEELKMTKAPSKTLAALAEFAAVRWRGVVVLLDRLEVFESAPADLRAKLAATLMQLRWTLKEHGVVSLILPEGVAPEVEESFAAATTVSWSFAEVDAVRVRDAVFDRGLAERWMASAGVAGELPAWADEVLGAVVGEIPFESALPILRDVIDQAAADGVVPTADRVARGLGGLEDVATR